MNFYFYKTTNNINGKFYYGSGQFDNYVGSGIALGDAIKKYGNENFTTEILKYFGTREEAYEFEERFLLLYKISQNPNSYNMKNAGLGGDTLSNHPNREEIVKKISEAGKNRIFTDEHRKNLSESAKKRKGNKPSKFKGMKYEDYLSEEKCIETKNKLSNHFKGKSYEELYGEEKSKEKKLNLSKYYENKRIKKINEYLDFLYKVNLNDLPNYKELNNILKFLNSNNIDCSLFSHIYEYIKQEKKLSRSNSQKGRIFSEKTKRKISNSAKGRVVSEETKRKISESFLKNKNTKIDKIIEYLDSINLSNNPDYHPINKALNSLIKCGINIDRYMELKEYIEKEKFRIRSEFTKERKLSQDTKEKIKKSLGTKIEIDGVVYYGYLDAERNIGIDRHKIKKLCLDINEENYKIL